MQVEAQQPGHVTAGAAACGAAANLDLWTFFLT